MTNDFLRRLDELVRMSEAAGRMGNRELCCRLLGLIEADTDDETALVISEAVERLMCPELTDINHLGDN